MIETVWFSDAAWARAVRATLAPLSTVFGAVSATRNRLYDTRALRTMPSPVPVVSVGNLSVGGTGKTPVTADLVRRLRDTGRVPAIVMRGYGDDESTVHTLLNPGVRVYANPDRVAGIAEAARDGADVVVLDDAFQHRRAARDVDVVLISAERWRSDERVLPAGSLREPLRALRRATVVAVTHRVAPPDVVLRIIETIRAIVPHAPVVPVGLDIGPLAAVAGTQSFPLTALAGVPVLAIAGVGDPDSFFAQLARAGALVTGRRFGDHHAYREPDVASLLASGSGHKYIVTTLKDAVKLRLLWPAKAPSLWYVSQAVSESDGASLADATLRDLQSR